MSLRPPPLLRCWRGVDAVVNLHEVIGHEVEADGVHVVRQLFAECVGQPGEATHSHVHRQIGTLDG